MPDLRIKGLFDYQQVEADKPHRNKLESWGRRRGKSRFGLYCAVMGHGPLDETGEPIWKGIRHGLDVLWVGRSLDQARIIWNEEVKPRFVEAGGYVNDTLLLAQLHGTGRLIVRSQDHDSIQNVLGMGAQLAGVVCDEAARWADAEGVWLEILAPMLVDNRGWSVWISKPHAGSWFNAQCDRIEAHDPRIDPNVWTFSEGTLHDNPLMTPEAIAELIAEYSPEDPRLAEEVYAKRLAGGAGLAFPEWNNAVHKLPENMRVPESWRWVAGMDYGYANGGHVGLWACGPDGEVWLIWELRYIDLSPEQIGVTLGEGMPQYGKLPEWIGCDSSLWDAGPTIPELIQKALNATLGGARVPVVSVPKAPHSRVTSKALVHQLLRYERDTDGRPVPWAPPRLRVHPRCTYFLATFPTLPRDEKNSEDVDTTSADHAYDAMRYMLMCRQPKADREAVVIPENVHPGFRPDGSRRPRVQTPETDAEEYAMLLAKQGVSVGGRYGGRR